MKKIIQFLWNIKKHSIVPMSIAITLLGIQAMNTGNCIEVKPDSLKIGKCEQIIDETQIKQLKSRLPK